MLTRFSIFKFLIHIIGFHYSWGFYSSISLTWSQSSPRILFLFIIFPCLSLLPAFLLLTLQFIPSLLHFLITKVASCFGSLLLILEVFVMCILNKLSVPFPTKSLTKNNGIYEKNRVRDRSADPTNAMQLLKSIFY